MHADTQPRRAEAGFEPGSLAQSPGPSTVHACDCRAGAWLFAGDHSISIITIPITGLLGTTQSSCFNLINPRNNTYKEILLLSSPPFYRGATQSTERLNSLPDITWTVELDLNPAIRLKSALLTMTVYGCGAGL